MSNADVSNNGGIGRRNAIKAGAAAVVGTVVWAGPSIKGLARRPAYAESASGNPLDLPFSFILGRGDSDTVTVDGVTITITRGTGGQGSDDYTISSSSGASLSISIAVNGEAPTVFSGGNPLDITVGPNGNQDYTVIGTVTCA